MPDPNTVNKPAAPPAPAAAAKPPEPAKPPVTAAPPAEPAKEPAKEPEAPKKPELKVGDKVVLKGTVQRVDKDVAYVVHESGEGSAHMFLKEHLHKA